MATFLQYGDNDIPFGVSAPTITREYERDQFGNPWLEIQRWDIDVRLVKTATSDLKTQIETIEGYFASPVEQMHVLDNDGEVTAHSVGEGATLGGIRTIAGPSYVQLTRGENVTVRNLAVTVEFVLPKYTSDTRIIAREETTGFVQKGINRGMSQPNVGLGELQQTRTAQHATFVQSGSITWAAAYGALPEYLMPARFLVRQPRFTIRQPRYIGYSGNLAAVGHTIEYEYEFAAPESMIAAPTVLT